MLAAMAKRKQWRSESVASENGISYRQREISSPKIEEENRRMKGSKSGQPLASEVKAWRHQQQKSKSMSNK
jgi:hypothetical protein